MTTHKVKQKVKEKYAKIAEGKLSDCCDEESSPSESSFRTNTMAGEYPASELREIPEEANLGLGCGTPTALLDLQEGHTVLDLGSGGGIDVFLAAGKVGPTGRAIGIDMTSEMIEKARGNARKAKIRNVEFLLGEIEDLPVEEESMDRVISNCVINLVPNKKKVFREIYRVLKVGGSFVVSDIVTSGEIPDAIRQDMELWAGCVAGAVKKQTYLDIIAECGFENISILSEKMYDYGRTESYGLLSITVRGQKRSRKKLHGR